MSRTLAAFFLLFVLIGAAAAETTASDAPSSPSADDVGKWLVKAANAVRTGTYRGVMVYLRQNQLDTLRVVHRFHDDVEQERLVAVSGRPREIIRQGSRVTSILPAGHVVLVTQHQERGNLLARVSEFSSEHMQSNYRMQALGSKRLADRPTHVVSIQPRDDYRYGYRILIDKETWLPLKLSLLFEADVLEQIMFTSIDYPDELPGSEFEPSYDIDGFQVINQETSQVEDTALAETKWTLAALPPGFEQVESGIRSTPSGHIVRQMLFTDGVATVSAFIAPADVQKPLVGGSTMGAVNAYGRIAGSYHITVVGEVPAVTVRMIAENLELEAPSRAQANDDQAQ